MATSWLLSAAIVAGFFASGLATRRVARIARIVLAAVLVAQLLVLNGVPHAPVGFRFLTAVALVTGEPKLLRPFGVLRRE